MERARSGRGLDAGVAVVMAVIGLVEVFLAPPNAYPYAVVVPTAIALAVPLVVRRTHPLPALGLVLAVVVAQRLMLGELWDSGSTIAIPLIAVYSAAAYTDLRRAAAAYAVNVAVLSVCDIDDGGDAADVAFIALIYGAIWIAGRMTRRQRVLAEENAEYARELERLQAEREQAAALAERGRIARELHDVVAHCVSTMVVQAEAGQALLATDIDRARDAFGAIQESGRDALTDLRRMLGLLRDGQDGSRADHAPQPNLARLDGLLDGFRDTGLAVDLEVQGDPRPLPHDVDLSAFRIVQESLTNTLKHAGATRVTVRLGYADRGLDIEVVDNGGGGTWPTNGSGHGLLGMRERAQMHGGTHESRALPGGGYVVRARLPL